MIRTVDEGRVELEVVTRECRFIDGLRLRFQEVLQQLQREESQLLGLLAPSRPPLPATTEQSTESAAAEDAAKERSDDLTRAPPSPRTPPLRPLLALDPLRISGNSLMPKWRLESEDMPSPHSDSADSSVARAAPDAAKPAEASSRCSNNHSGPCQVEQQPAQNGKVHGDSVEQEQTRSPSPDRSPAVSSSVAPAPASPPAAATAEPTSTDVPSLLLGLRSGRRPKLQSFKLKSCPSLWPFVTDLEETHSPFSDISTTETLTELPDHTRRRRRPSGWQFLKQRTKDKRLRRTRCFELEEIQQ